VCVCVLTSLFYVSRSVSDSPTIFASLDCEVNVKNKNLRLTASVRQLRMSATTGCNDAANTKVNRHKEEGGKGRKRQNERERDRERSTT
jgi:hypothetical protein